MKKINGIFSKSQNYKPTILINKQNRKYLRLLLILQLLIGSLFLYSTPAVSSGNWFANRIDTFRASCVYTFGFFRKKTIEEEMEAFRYAAQFFLEARIQWNPPESRANLTEEEARAFLADLVDRNEFLDGGYRVNGNRLFRHHDSTTNLDFYIKHYFSRTELAESKPVKIRNYVKYEALAFALDRFIGGYLVLPAYLLAPDKVAILAAPKTVSADYLRVKKNLALFRQTAYIDTLDAIFANADRRFANNILIDSEGNLIAHDWDRSSPSSGIVPWAVSNRLWLHKVPVKTADGKIKFLDIPLLVEPKIFEQMEELTPSLFVELGKAVGVVVNPEEASIITGNTLLLAQLFRERWIKSFGSIEAPERKLK